MAMSTTLPDRELAKFQETDGQTTVRVTGIAGSLISDLSFDAIDVNYPSATVETYAYYTGGLAGTLLATVTVTYTSSTKDDIESVVRT